MDINLKVTMKKLKKYIKMDKFEIRTATRTFLARVVQ